MIESLDDYESVLWVARECYVYRLPPRTSTAGYKAAEWGDMEAFLWKGRLRIIEKGTESPTKCFIRLEDSDTGELFANCPYSLDGKSVEPVLDSSRYYVIRVEDISSGQRAFLGMGFPERSDSFDFNVTLQDWTKRQKFTTQSTVHESTSSPHLPSGPKRDFSLKEGQTISICLGGRSSPKKKSTSSDPPSSTNGPLPFLPPPPAPRGR
ncbi:adaptin ear-binding coat-associated protein 1 NECAP-1 [Melampsora americana]|nr:adaptin ear-binding coat-associated protein 1 NECAP-1 [Melampsora americana]